MRRIPALLALCAALMLQFAPSRLAAQSADNLAAGMAAMSNGEWEDAIRLAKRDGQVADDIIEWHRLRAGRGTYGQVIDFVERRYDWPGLDWLMRKSEPAFEEAPHSVVREVFGKRPAQTAEGVLIHARALENSGETGEAQANLVIAWRTMPMGATVQAEYLRDHRALLAAHHEARLDRLLWDNHLVSARRMLPLVSDGAAKLAETRIALQDLAPGVDARIAAVPEALRSDPGLAHDRFVWRDRKGRDADAITLMLERSTSAESLGLPAKWGERRRVLARQKMRELRGARAYQIASTHHMSPEDGYVYADLEWIAGFVALRQLNDPATALTHFQRFDAAIASPISKGRAGYWIGRAYEAMGDETAARLAYIDGSEYQTSFYGLLAAQRVGLPFDDRLIGATAPEGWQSAAFRDSSVFQAGLLLIAAGEANLAERFITHLAEDLNADEAAQLGEIALSMDRPHLAVMIGKRVAQRGIVIPRAYYAVHPVGRMELPMSSDMNLAIARRESEFDPRVVSGAGARGLMQVMPATARDVARDIGVLAAHSTGRLTEDWRYNARLGSRYLADLAGTFNGNVVLMSAGYNAGPSRPLRWMNLYGDPRRARVDMVDWIEFIPFRETRNYVMRVAESLPVYRARLGQDPHPVPFMEELTGSTLRAFAP